MKVLFLDEISTGLDSSTTFSIVKSLKRFARAQSGTVLVSLLQPAPETFNLFDDVLLLSEGQVRHISIIFPKYLIHLGLFFRVVLLTRCDGQKL